MDSLPHFLYLVKHNVVLYSIITTGSFSNIDLSKLDYYIWSDKGIEFSDFELGKDEIFPKIHFAITEEIGMLITFSTKESKYFDNPTYYFGNNTFTKTNRGLEGSEVSTKELKFYDFDPPLAVFLRYSPFYGYVVVLKFDKNLKDRYEKYSVDQILEMYVGLCKFKSDTEVERTATSAQYRLLEVLQVLRDRNGLELLGTLFNHEDQTVRTEAAKHFLLVNEKRAKRILRRMARSGDLEESKYETIISKWEEGTSNFQY